MGVKFQSCLFWWKENHPSKQWKIFHSNSSIISNSPPYYVHQRISFWHNVMANVLLCGIIEHLLKLLTTLDKDYIERFFDYPCHQWPKYLFLIYLFRSLMAKLYKLRWENFPHLHSLSSVAVWLSDRLSWCCHWLLCL